METASATASANYVVNGGVTVLSAQFGPDNRTIVLTTTPMALNGTYTLTVNNVRDLASTPNTIVPNTQRTFTLTARPLNLAFVLPNSEPLGPATRRGPLVISEVMYHPTNRTDLRNVEFIEIYNSNPWFEEMGGFKISGVVDYTFPSNFVLQARSYVVVAAVPADVQAVYSIAGVLGPWIGSLQNGDGTLRLRNATGAVLFEMEYTGDPPYPAAADGAGHSLVLARPSYGAGDVRAWSASDIVRGTPGAGEVAGANPQRAVMINEFLAHTDLPDLDYIELFNYSAQSVNIAGCVLTDDPLTNKFIIPVGTVIPANEFLVFYETNLGFALLRAEGETIYFKNAANTRVLDAVRFEAQENGVATGRYPDGAPSFDRLQTKTPGTNNARVLPPRIVINEIMYDPVSDDGNDEFIELYNPGTNAANVSKWRLKDAVKFTIPNNTFIAPNSYLVIAANKDRLRANNPGLNSANCLGDWGGGLKNSGERITLTMPDQIISTNALGGLVTNTMHIVMDEVSYRDGGRWGKWSGRGGSSLELRDWRSDRRLAPNWADSDETLKSGWVNIEATGVMDNGYENATQLHITLMGTGEALIDNVELYSPNYGGGNLIGNGTFDTDINNWVFQGNHNQTSWETTQGYSGGRSLHLRAAGRGDTGANRVRTQLPFTLASGSTVTLRAKVRWLKGNPNILLRIRGNYFELPGFMLAAKNLGTPGTRNSTASTNAGPAITGVAHWPTIPAANQPVLITARASDSDGIATMLLRYRLDPSTNFTVLAMTNNGAGIFSTVIPGQPTAALAGFYVQGADKLAPATGTTFPNDAPQRECLVRWGDPAAPANQYLGAYRFWISQANVDHWAAEEKMSNNPKDVTFLYGTNRVTYNAGAWFHGSPYHS
ncbi:MAG TPA: lamin tail domain-containing protein, partial [Candidatus Limnocylindria bacterium]|nr:lamin tail domain-containing protein [Candidatus Limnocylindria bacterium]